MSGLYLRMTAATSSICSSPFSRVACPSMLKDMTFSRFG
jgi:hypothetical protein